VGVPYINRWAPYIWSSIAAAIAIIWSGIVAARDCAAVAAAEPPSAGAPIGSPSKAVSVGWSAECEHPSA
jgi:hypothetical protein